MSKGCSEEKRKKSWRTSHVIAQVIGIEECYAKNVEDLLRADHTIPFIARYRKSETGDMSTDQLFKLKQEVHRLDNLAKKIEKSLSDIEKLGRLTPALGETIAACTSSTSLDQVTAAYKAGKKKTRAEQARSCGLVKASEIVMHGGNVDMNRLVGSHEKLTTPAKVAEGVRDLLVDHIRNNKLILELCEGVAKSGDNVIECSKSKSKMEDEHQKEKFDQYFEFKRNIGSLKHFQVMAINRGENVKALSVKVSISPRAENSVKWRCADLLRGVRDQAMKTGAVEDACSRLIFPLVVRRIRASLTEAATESSVGVFAENLKNLLLTPPVKNCTLLALDPGYKHGCKVAVVDAMGGVLCTETLFLRQGSINNAKVARFQPRDEDRLEHFQKAHSYTLVAIGNGKGCRETEAAVASMIASGQLAAGTQYTIVEERGASVYSVAPIAQEELPNMDTNHRSAVSIGRRVIDPLSEYVKIEPKHLGVGQYQHDIQEKRLSNRLDEVLIEAVSFTGLDLNNCGLHMLQKIAGLTKARAKAILDTRNKLGKFTNREQIRSIKGIGPKSYEQCIGFLRVYPNNSPAAAASRSRAESGDSGDEYQPSKLGKRKLKIKPGTKSKLQKLDICYLDQTSVHPESYKVAREIASEQGVQLSGIGSEKFVREITKLDPSRLTRHGDEATVAFILSALSQKLDTDYRDQFSRPIFKSQITTSESVVIGSELEGRVSNVTHFGAFVDVGLDRDGLVHVSKMRGMTVKLGDRVCVTVDKRDHKGLGLILQKILL